MDAGGLRPILLVTAQQLDDCINQNCDVHGYCSIELGSFQDFVGILKQQFASSNNLILPAEDMFERLSKVPL